MPTPTSRMCRAPTPPDRLSHALFAAVNVLTPCSQAGATPPAPPAPPESLAKFLGKQHLGACPHLYAVCARRLEAADDVRLVQLVPLAGRCSAPPMWRRISISSTRSSTLLPSTRCVRDGQAVWQIQIGIVVRHESRDGNARGLSTEGRGRGLGDSPARLRRPQAIPSRHRHALWAAASATIAKSTQVHRELRLLEIAQPGTPPQCPSTVSPSNLCKLPLHQHLPAPVFHAYLDWTYTFCFTLCHYVDLLYATV